MVKNKVGGKRTKRGARKNINEIQSIHKKIRFIQEEGEEYAIVNKIIGNGQCIVRCGDDKERLCFIRNKFSGRNKHSNLVHCGTWVMIGKREWETKQMNKLEKCDLLELYNNDEKNRLIQDSNYNFKAITNEESKLMHLNNEEEEDHILFQDNDEIDDSIHEIKEEDDSIIDFDEI